MLVTAQESIDWTAAHSSGVYAGVLLLTVQLAKEGVIYNVLSIFQYKEAGLLERW